MTGIVIEFDESSGLGAVLASSGERFGFHCTQIADGTRSIAVGAAVRFDTRAWHQGRFEAVGIEAQP